MILTNTVFGSIPTHLINLKCIGCGGEYEEFWELNPPGGYGRPQVIICTDCCKMDNFKNARERLIDCGVVESEKEIIDSPSFKRIK